MTDQAEQRYDVEAIQRRRSGRPSIWGRLQLRKYRPSHSRWKERPGSTRPETRRTCPYVGGGGQATGAECSHFLRARAGTKTPTEPISDIGQS